jgi:hypothetical protein
MSPNTSGARVAYSPGEFAALFGKSQTWGYRQIYAGKVKAITEHGRMLIPVGEVTSILAKAGIYDGLKPKALKTKTEVAKFAPKLPDAWRKFLERRREESRRPVQLGGLKVRRGSRGAVLDRLTRGNDSRVSAAGKLRSTG